MHKCFWEMIFAIIKFRISYPEVFLEKRVLQIGSKFTEECPYRSAISIKLKSKFIEITLQHGCSHVNLLDIFRTPFLKNTSGRLVQQICISTIFVISNVHFFLSNFRLSHWLPAHETLLYLRGDRSLIYYNDKCTSCYLKLNAYYVIVSTLWFSCKLYSVLI